MKKWLKILIIIISIIIISLVIDLIFIFNFSRPLFGIKVDNGDSINTVYKGIFYNVYNCADNSIAQIKSKTEKYNCKINIKENSELTGVSMVIKKGTLKASGATVIITDTNEEKYSYGSYFRIEENKNDTWAEVEKIGPANFNYMAYLVDKNNKLELEQNWGSIYGSLKPGKYRIVKDVCISDECKEKKEIYAAFTIE